jgi:hypothetical protein
MMTARARTDSPRKDMHTSRLMPIQKAAVNRASLAAPIGPIPVRSRIQELRHRFAASRKVNPTRQSRARLQHICPVADLDC